MSTKNEITDAKIENKILEARVDLSQSFLNENEEIRKAFDYEKKVIKYQISSLVPDEIISELKIILEKSSSKDLVHINPIILALAELESLKLLKYNKEDSTTVDSFKQAKKLITNFGQGLTAAKKILKEPHLDYNRKIDKIYDLFNTEKETVKNCLEENFKEYLDEESKKKAELEAKKKAAELEKIAKLSEENEKLIAMAAKSENNKIYLQYESSIAKILTDVSVNILNLNIEGLDKLNSKFSSLSFDKVLKEEHKSLFSPEQIQTLSNQFDKNIDSSRQLIADKIQSIRNSENLKNVEMQNKILESQTTKSLELPENNPPIVENIEQKDNSISTNEKSDFYSDSEIFNFLISDLKELQSKINQISSKLKSYQFSNNNVSQIRDIIVDKSLPKIDEWSTKLIEWSEAKQVLINQLK